MRFKSSAVLILTTVLLTAGCASARRETQPGADPATRAAKVSGVPFFADTTDQCGPSTLASLLTFWGHPTSPSELRQEIYLPKLKGTLPMDMVSAAEARGLKADGSNGSLDLLRTELMAGRPVLAYLDKGFSFYPIGHYVVVTGFDDAKQGVYMHSAGHENEFASYRKFSKQWDRTDRWLLLVSAKDPAKENP